MRSFLSIVAAPTLCLGLLGAVVWENSRHVKEVDTAPFHAAAKQAVDAWPTTAGDWEMVKTEPLPKAAVQLLHPNAYFYRVYARTHSRDPAPAGLLVVQCSHPDDMSGHYPPNCYPSNGSPTLLERPRTWNIPGLLQPIHGMEYHFREWEKIEGRDVATIVYVYDFFVLPGRGMVGEMEKVREASGDYQRRHYGAAQIQVIFKDSTMDDETREAAFVALMKSGVDVLKTLNPPGI